MTRFSVAGFNVEDLIGTDRGMTALRHMEQGDRDD